MRALALVLAAIVLTGCGSSRELVQVASLESTQITGIAVTDSGRVIVNSPRWHPGHGASVMELTEGEPTRYPDGSTNAWTPLAGDPARQWVCVQSVHVDGKGRLWVLDPGAPNLGGLVEGAAKLVEIDPRSDSIVRTIYFDKRIAPEGSYLNDVRIDTRDDFAFITDSGLGAIVIVDLKSGRKSRVLADHSSTKAEEGFNATIQGVEWNLPVHADGIAIVPEGDADRGGLYGGWVYWQALSGRTLYRAHMSLLKANPANDARIAAAVENLGQTVMTDGMASDEFGNIYFSALEEDAVMYRTPSGKLRMLVSDERIAWPDSFAWGPEGDLFFTTARIHQSRWFGNDVNQGPFEVYRVAPAGK